MIHPKAPKFRSWMARRRNANIYEAMGMPVPGYWQRRADRKINAEIAKRTAAVTVEDAK